MIAVGRNAADAGPGQRAPAGTPPPLSAMGLRYAYGADRVLDGVDLTLRPGEVLALLGPNGAGKSTLLRMLAGLQEATEGDVRWWGHPAATAPAGLRARVGVVGHRSFLFEDLTAVENLAYYGELLGLPSPEALARDRIAAEGLGLFADRPVATFSRGMTQRLAICRAWLARPDLVLADEAETGLDPEAVARLRLRLSEVRAAGGSVVLVAHDHASALRLADRYAILSAGRLADAGLAAPWRDRPEAFAEHYRTAIGEARRQARRRPSGPLEARPRAQTPSPPAENAAAGARAAAVATAVLRRDARLWLRGRERLSTLLAMGLLEALVFGFALDPTAQDLRPVFAGVLWTALLFAALPAFGRSFADEWANDALAGFRAVGGDPAALFYGKCLGHLAAFAAAMTVLIPAFFALLQVATGAGLWPALAALGLGALGFVPAASLTAAVVTRALGPRGGALLPLIALPLLAPGILGTVRAAQSYLGAIPEAAAPWMWMLGAYALLFWALPSVLFPVVADS